MKTSTKTILAVAVVVALAAGIVGSVLGLTHGRVDIIAAQAVTAFDELIAKLPANEAADGWILAAPDGTVRFVFGEDTLPTDPRDAYLKIYLAPFTNAGLDVSRLPADYTVIEDTLILGADLSPTNAARARTATATLSMLIDASPNALGYHSAMAHFGIMLGDWAMVEWAANLDENDKDLVFALAPDPLIAAGVEPDSVAGWVYAQVPVHMDGKSVEVWKFLKPFDLSEGR
ncbi:MAG: hypothetical protein LBN05_02720 [Oscillospiraceae bacterium]|jgi:hypothetical protein|nr:hypothetical protein [Oscillospiraceae bacterium]